MSAIVISVTGDYNGKDIANARRDLNKLEQAAGGSGFKSFGEKLKGWGDSIASAGKKMTVGITLPLVALGVLSVNTAAEFETTMNQLAAATSAPAAEVKKLSDLATELGAQTIYSANDAADAMLELAKGGLKPVEIAAGGVQASMALAATEGMGLADASTVVSNAMSTFGIKAAKAGKVADILAAGSVASTASVSSLAQALSQVGPGAKNAGLSLSETVAVLAAFDAKGIKGSDAGTSLKTMLQRLVPQTDAAAAMMKKLGLNFVDSEGNFKSITNVAKQLHDKLKPLTEAERAQALQVMFGSDATRAATVLMNLGKKGLDEYTNATKEQGKAQELANARMSGTAGAIERARGSIETAMKAIGDALAPLVEKVAGWIEQAASAFAGLDPHMQQMIMIFGLVAAAAGPLLIIIGSLVTAIGAIVGVLGAVSLPALAVVAPIAAVVAVVVLLWNKSEAFRNGVIAVWNAVKAAVAQAVDGLKAKLAENQDKVDALKDGFSKFWQFLQTYVIPAIAKFYEVYLSTLIKVIGWVIEKYIDFYSAIWDVIQIIIDAGRKVWEFGGKVKDAIGVAVDWVSQLPDTVKRLFGDAVSWLWDAGKNIVMGLWNGIKGAWDSMVAWVEEKVNALPEAVKAVLHINSPAKVMIPIGAAIPEGIAVGVTAGAEKPKAALRKLGKELAGLSKKQLQAALDKATDLKDAKSDRLSKLQDYFDRIRSIVTDSFDALKDQAQARIDELQGKLDELVSAASDFGSSIRQALSVSFSTSGEGSVLEQFRQSITDGQAFLGQIKQLRAAGLNETSLQQIIQAGVDQGKKVADSLLAEGPGAINEVNQLQAAFQSQVGALADEMSQQKFGAQIDEARTALQAAQASYAAIVAREAEQLAQLDALGKKFGLETDKMTLTLDAAQKQITEILSHEDTATTLLTDAVSEVTTGLLETADKMAKKAAALQRDISSLETRITAINSALNTAKPAGRAVGGPTDAGTPYWVGERGPEIFVPSVSGTVLTAAQSARAAASGSSSSAAAGRAVVIEAGAVVVYAPGADKADVQAAIDSAFADLVREINRS